MKYRITAVSVLASTFLDLPTRAQDSAPLGESRAVAQNFLRAVTPGAANDDFAAPIFDEAEDGSLWIRGRNYKAHVDSNGLTFIPFLGSRAPRDFPVSFRLRSASIGADALPLAFGAGPLRDDRRVYVEHGSVTEVFDFTADDVEQSFVARRGAARGDLVLGVDVDTSLKRAAGPNGLWFGCAKGAVHSGWAASRDASGRELATTSLPDHDGLEFVVPASEIAKASGDITIDPIISTAITDGSAIDDFDPDVAYDAQNDMYLLVYDETYSQTDHDVRSQFVSGATGQPIANTLAYIDASTADWRQPAVANQASSHQFLVAASVSPSPELIKCRTRLANSITMSNQFVISINMTGGLCPSPNYRRNVAPTVSGDSNPATGNPFLVGWVCNLINPDGLGHETVCENLYVAAVSSTGVAGTPVWAGLSQVGVKTPSPIDAWVPSIANGSYESACFSKSNAPTGGVLAWRHRNANTLPAMTELIEAFGVSAGANLAPIVNPTLPIVDFSVPLPGSTTSVSTMFNALSVSSMRNTLDKTRQLLIAFDALGPQGGSRLYGALLDYTALTATGTTHPTLLDLTKLEEAASPGSTFQQWTPSIDSDGSNYLVSFEASTVGGNALACAEFAFHLPIKSLTETIYCDEPQLLLTTPTAMPMGRSRVCTEKSGGGTRPYTLVGSTRFGATGGDPFIAMHSH